MATGGCASKTIICYPSAIPVTVPDFGISNLGHSSYSYPTLELAELHTYSPGLYCPSGMTTATTVDTWDGPGVVCCPR